MRKREKLRVWCVCEREREKLCVCVCVRERKRYKQFACVCVRERERERDMVRGERYKNVSLEKFVYSFFSAPIAMNKTFNVIE